MSGAGFMLQAVNLNKGIKDSGFDGMLQSPTSAQSATVDTKILHRTTKRVSLTCRLVLKVRKNLIKI